VVAAPPSHPITSSGPVPEDVPWGDSAMRLHSIAFMTSKVILGFKKFLFKLSTSVIISSFPEGAHESFSDALKAVEITRFLTGRLPLAWVAYLRSNGYQNFGRFRFAYRPAFYLKRKIDGFVKGCVSPQSAQGTSKKRLSKTRFFYLLSVFCGKGTF
jgi:hypothetical protein